MRCVVVVISMLIAGIWCHISFGEPIKHIMDSSIFFLFIYQNDLLFFLFIFWWISINFVQNNVDERGGEREREIERSKRCWSYLAGNPKPACDIHKKPEPNKS